MGQALGRWIGCAGVLLLAACAYEPGALTPLGPAGGVAEAAGPAAVPAVRVDPAARVGSDRPLIVIQFAGPDVDYEDALAEALRGALAAQPWSRFALVAVAPSPGAATPLGPAEAVLRSLHGLGVAPERVRLTVAEVPGAAAEEVRLYLR